MISKNDVRILRELASQVAAIAALPVQEEKRRMWRLLNARRPVRPMVMIDQICWNELTPGGELELQCADAECRRHEQTLRRELYQWRHFPVDMVVEPFIRVPKAIVNTGFGINIEEETAVTDPTNAVVAHRYENQFARDEDLEKMQMPKVSHDQAETERRLALAHEIFDGVMEVRAWGAEPYLSLWDRIAMWMGGENVLYALIDRGEFMHRLADRMTTGYELMLDQLEAQGLLSGPQSLVHCTGAWTDELPAPGYNPDKPRTQDMWMYGLAQIFSTVSPTMFKEFEIDYTARLCARFGLVYYGCCDPLHGKMAEVRALPRVRKVSMSPWVDEEQGAREIAGEFVYSRKPNPALLAAASFDPELVRAEFRATRRVCDKYGCPLEYILKDLSTVGREPRRLDAWARIAMEEVGG